MQSTYKIKKQDYDQFTSRKTGNKVELIWSDILVSLDNSLRKEAKQKGFMLAEKDKSKNVVRFELDIPGASKPLAKTLKKFNTVLMSA